MHEIAELERRITAAMDRIGLGLGALAEAARTPAAPVVVASTGRSEAELAELREALDEERMANAQLNERLRVLRDRDARAQAEAQGEVDRLTRLLDEQGLETQRLHKLTVKLREDLRQLREAAEDGTADAAMINKAMLAELEALRADRSAEAAEMRDIIAAIHPLLREEEMRLNA
jgi:hypothetical protein